jgi:hypothetical protein
MKLRDSATETFRLELRSLPACLRSFRTAHEAPTAPRVLKTIGISARPAAGPPFGCAPGFLNRTGGAGTTLACVRQPVRQDWRGLDRGRAHLPRSLHGAARWY